MARRREGRDLARPAGRVDDAAAVGTIVEQPYDGPVVACGDGALLLEEVETSGELEVGAVLG